MKRLILFLCATLLCGAAALAQTYQETVYLKNGSIIKGTVLEQEAGGNIKIMTSDGSIFVYKSDEVQKITKEAVSTSRSKSSKGTASAEGEAFRGWRVSPGLGIGTTFGDYAMASGVLEFGLGKDVSDQIYLGFGAQGSIPFKEGVDPSFSAFLENRIYFPSSSSVSSVFYRIISYMNTNNMFLNLSYLEYNSTISVSFTGTSICSRSGFSFTLPERESTLDSIHAGTAMPLVTSAISLKR